MPARCLVRAAETGPRGDRAVRGRPRRAGHRAGHAAGSGDGARQRRDRRRAGGTVATRVELASDGTPSRVKPVYPSLCDRPALPVASAGTIVPDLPPADRSLNPSYAGNGL